MTIISAPKAALAPTKPAVGIFWRAAGVLVVDRSTLGNAGPYGDCITHAAGQYEGQVLVVDPEGGHWVRFVVTRAPVSPDKPHGLDYSLTLHGPDGERLVGFDNAHPVARQKRGEPQDHRHRLRTIKAYDYRDAATQRFLDHRGRGVARERSPHHGGSARRAPHCAR